MITKLSLFVHGLRIAIHLNFSLLRLGEENPGVLDFLRLIHHARLLFD